MFGSIAIAVVVFPVNVIFDSLLPILVREPWEVHRSKVSAGNLDFLLLLGINVVRDGLEICGLLAFPSSGPKLIAVG